MATVTFTGLNSGGTPSFADWNTATNWTPTGVPTAVDSAVLTSAALGTNIVISGTTDLITNVTMSGDNLFVGESGFGGTAGAGGLTASGTISLDSDNLVSTAGSTITAAGGFNLTGAGAALGGGGTFNGTISNAGVVRADGNAFGLGDLIVNGAISGASGAIEIYAGSALTLNGATSETVTIDNPGVAAGTGTLTLSTPASFTGPIDVSAGNVLDLTLTGETISNMSVDSVTGTVTFTAGTQTFTVNAAGTGIGANASGSSITVGQGVVCFARGTRIATATGPVAVEDLVEGDVVLTAGGEEQAITWIGRRHVDCRRHPEPRQVWPVRIQAGAFGPAMPARDVCISPQHAIYDEGVLIPAKLLVNGRTIRQERVATVEYFHVELARHDILLAEGLPAESYLDTGDRASFENAPGAIVLHPDFSRWAWDGRACAELKVTGSELDAVRAKVALHAEAIGKRVSAAV